MSEEEEDQRRAIAKEAAHEAVRETFKLLGVDVETEEGRREFRETISWARRLKQTTDSSTRKLIVTMVGVMTAGLMYAIWEGIKSTLN